MMKSERALLADVRARRARGELVRVRCGSSLSGKNVVLVTHPNGSTIVLIECADYHDATGLALRLATP